MKFIIDGKVKAKFCYECILSLLEWIVTILIVLECRSVYTVAIDKDYHFSIILMCTLFILDLLYVYSIKISASFIKSMIFLVFWSLYILLFYLISGGEGLIQQYFINFTLLFILCYFLIVNNRWKKILLKYTSIIIILSIVALFFWTFGTMLNILGPNGTVLIDWGTERVCNGYYGIYYEVPQTFDFIRNTGIFTEPPMFSLQLTIAFALEFLINTPSKSRTLKLVILFFTILSSFSTTGMIFIALLISMNQFKKTLNNFKNRRLSIFFPILIVIVLLIVSNLFQAKMDSLSGSTRLDDYMAAYKAWTGYKFFGYGYGNASDIVTRYISSFRYGNTGNSNSLMVILVEGGIYFALAFIIPFIVVLIKSLRRDFNVFIMVVLWFYLFATTMFPHNYLMITFLAFMYAYLLIRKSPLESQIINIAK